VIKAFLGRYDATNYRKEKQIKEINSHYNAISTSSLARYEYKSGDIRYLSMPAKIMSDLDFFLSDPSV
jgi:hypothetical protein